MHGQTLLSPGDTIAGYEIESAVARGGFAVVYRARDVELGRRVVALKVIAPELAGNDKFRQRFIRESELAASIDHPNILPVYRAGEDRGVLYIAMRFVEGQDLGKFLARRGVPPLDVALAILTQVAAALDVAHAHGLVHRDVKPGNILVGDQPGHDGVPHVYLADFGLTKRSSSLSGLTTARHFIGTPAYSAPEQISGGAVDSRTDIYSLGCVVHEALTGQPPFQRDEDMALLWAHVYTEPSPASQLRPDLPPAVDAVLARALAKQPEERPATCRELVTQLRVAFRGLPPAAGHPVPARVPALPTAPPTAPPAAPPAGRPPVLVPVPAAGPQGRGTPPSGPAAPSLRGPAPIAAPARGGRRRWPVPVAALIAVLLVALAGYWFLGRGGARYDGDQPNATWLSFDHPTAWQAHPHADRVCFCTGNFGPTFLSGEWSNVAKAQEAGTDVQGVLVHQTAAYTLDDAEDAGQNVASGLQVLKPQLQPAQHVTLGGRWSWRVDGTAADPADPSRRLRLRTYLLLNQGGDKTDILLMFADDGSVDGTFDDLARSLTFRAGG